MPPPQLQPKDLLWLACPACHGAFVLERDTVRCVACDRRYPVVDGIPVLLATRTV